MRCIECEFFEIKEVENDDCFVYCHKYEKMRQEFYNCVKYLGCMGNEKYRPVRCADCLYLNANDFCDAWKRHTERGWWCCRGINKQDGGGWR